MITSQLAKEHEGARGGHGDAKERQIFQPVVKQRADGGIKLILEELREECSIQHTEVIRSAGEGAVESLLCPRCERRTRGRTDNLRGQRRQDGEVPRGA